jgi:hypothetical protein
MVSRLVNPLLMRLGIVPTLAVRGRTSGEWRSVSRQRPRARGSALSRRAARGRPVGRNLRAAGRGELRRRGRTEPFRVTEITDDEKPRIIEAYLARWGYQVRPYFRALPNAADHPVFSIERS